MGAHHKTIKLDLDLGALDEGQDKKRQTLPEARKKIVRDKKMPAPYRSGVRDQADEGHPHGREVAPELEQGRPVEKARPTPLPDASPFRFADLTRTHAADTRRSVPTCLQARGRGALLFERP